MSNLGSKDTCEKEKTSLAVAARKIVSEMRRQADKGIPFNSDNYLSSLRSALNMIGAKGHEMINYENLEDILEKNKVHHYDQAKKILRSLRNESANRKISKDEIIAIFKKLAYHLKFAKKTFSQLGITKTGLSNLKIKEKLLTNAGIDLGTDSVGNGSSTNTEGLMKKEVKGLDFLDKDVSDIMKAEIPGLGFLNKDVNDIMKTEVPGLGFLNKDVSDIMKTEVPGLGFLSKDVKDILKRKKGNT